MKKAILICVIVFTLGVTVAHAQTPKEQPKVAVKQKPNRAIRLLKKIGHGAWYYPLWAVGKTVYLMVNEE